MITKKAVLDLRASALVQHPESELHDHRQLAQQRGLQVVGTYEDRITVAKTSRPGLDRR